METDIVQAVNKAQLRKKALELRNSISQVEFEQKSSLITEALISTDIFKAAKQVMCYLSFDSEVSTWEIAKYCLKTGKHLSVPKIAGISGKYGEMIACEVTDLRTGLEQGTYGIKEPVCAKPVPVSQLDLILVPGLLFNSNKHRLGYGGGYYDRFLRRKGTGCRSIGLYFERQLYENIPVENHDLPLDKIITEKRMLL